MFKPLTILLLLLPFGCLAQNDSTGSKTLITKFENYTAKHISEKAYLHFDRPYYAAGDTVYFKAYITLGGTHELSALSGVLQVELIDNTINKPLLSEKLQITNGVAWGDFVLPDTLAKGDYRVRAYTQLMRNNNETGFFEQNIPIAAVLAKNIVKKPATAVSTAPLATPIAAKPDLQFFPEGGSLVTGVNSKVAFKAIGPNGMGIAVKGEIVDNENNQVCSFASLHLGMGYFYLKPQAGKTYRAKISYPNGLQDEAALPQAEAGGIAMSVTNDSTLVVLVNLSTEKTYYQQNKGKAYTLAVYSGGSLTSIPCRLDSTTLQVLLYKRKLHTGITRLTLFSPSGEPLNERLLFIQNNDQLKLTLSSDKTIYNPREKVTINLNATDSKGIPVTGDFSVAVTDESKVPVDTNAESTIFNNLLLTSDLKGYVEQPNDYFNDQSYQAFSNLDLLMLTQGYRGFEWRQVLEDTATNKTNTANYPPEKLLSLKGTVKTLSNKPVPYAEVGLGAIKQLLVRDTTADANGNFEFNNLSISDTTKLLLRAGKGNKNWIIQVPQPDEPQITPLPKTDTSIQMIKPQIAAEMKRRYEQSGNMHTGIMLKEVDIHEDKNPEHLVQLLHSDNLNGAGRADQVIMGDQLVGCPTIAECLAALLHGVKLVYHGGPAPIIYSIRTPIELTGNTKPMAVSLDGVISDQSLLDYVSPADIYSIEVLEDPGYLTVYGSHASGGLLVITTRRGDERNFISIQPGLTTYNFKGFYKAHTFYSPKYMVVTTGSKNDERTTIYWQPVLLTDKDGKASFSFYTADSKGTYRVVLEGIGINGNIGSKVYQYKVQ
jgi:hypothetical protein